MFSCQLRSREAVARQPKHPCGKRLWYNEGRYELATFSAARYHPEKSGSINERAKATAS